MPAHSPMGISMRRSLAVTAALLSTACGAKQADVPAGPDPCEAAQAQLAARLGPELAGIKVRVPLPLPAPSPRGCAIVYTQVSEEMPEDVGEGDGMGGEMDHQLGISLPDAQGRQVLTLQPPPEHAPGPVTMKLALKDLTGDGQVEVISQEDAGVVGEAHRGLRVLTYAAGASNARVVFDEKLVVKTPEGLELIPDWRASTVDSRPAILLDGAGTVRIFSWNTSTQRFTFDEAATAARAPKLPTPAPATEAPVPAAPAEGDTAGVTTEDALKAVEAAGDRADARTAETAKAAEGEAAKVDATAKKTAAAAKKKAAAKGEAAKKKGKSLAEELKLDL